MELVTFVTLLENLQDHVKINGPLWKLMTAMCWIFAAVFVFSGVSQLKEVAEGQRHSYRAPITSFLAAVLFMTVPEVISMALSTVYSKTATSSPLSYVKGATGTNKSIFALFSFVSFIGYVFFIRGIYVLKQSGEPQRFQGQTVGKALTIMVAGLAAIYIDQTLKMLGATFGFNMTHILN